jgi:Protein of unknown function (DUF3365)
VTYQGIRRSNRETKPEGDHPMKDLKKIGIFLLPLFLITISTADAAKWKRGPDGELVPADAPAQTKATKRASGGVDAAAVARTRKHVQMLDDLYKTAVVLITEHYVKDPSILSAATASKALFAAMKQKGWHDARLLGFTDILFNPAENLPEDDFEKSAKAKLLDGAASYEEVVKIKGQDYLRMATPVPVVMERCVMCHANFKDKTGPIGAISYSLPLIR